MQRRRHRRGAYGTSLAFSFLLGRASLLFRTPELSSNRRGGREEPGGQPPGTEYVGHLAIAASGLSPLAGSFSSDCSGGGVFRRSSILSQCEEGERSRSLDPRRASPATDRISRPALIVCLCIHILDMDPTDPGDDPRGWLQLHSLVQLAKRCDLFFLHWSATIFKKRPYYNTGSGSPVKRFLEHMMVCVETSI